MISAIMVSLKICTMIYLSGLGFAKLLQPAEARWVKSKLLPLMAGLYAAGMLVPSIWLMYAIIIGTITMMSRSRAEAAGIYIVVALALPRLYAELTFGGLYIFQVDKWMMCAIGVAITWFRFPVADQLAGRWFDLPFLLVFALELVLVRGNNFTSGLRIVVVDIICYIFPYYIVSRTFRRPEDMRYFLIGLCCVSFVLSVIAVYESRFSFLVYEAIADRFGSADAGGGYSHQRSGMLRAHATLGDATVFGVFLSRAFIAAMPLRGFFRTKRSWLIMLGVLFLGLYAANARGAMVSLLIGIFAYDFYLRRYGSLSMKVGLVAMLYTGGLALAQVNTKVAERMGLAGDSIGTTDYRRMLFNRGMEEIAKHPFIGVSGEETYRALADLRQGEGIIDFVNGYIFYGMVAGWPGIIALVACFTLTALNSALIRRKLRRHVVMNDIGALVFSVGMMALVTCFTSGFGGRQEIILYLIIGIGSALSAMKLQPVVPARAAVVPASGPERGTTTVLPV